MQTIVISSFHPLISRNILATPLLKILTQAGRRRVVIVCPEKKKKFFEEEFAGPDVQIEGIVNKLNWRDNLLRYLALAGLDTASLRIKRKTEMKGSGAWIAALLGNTAFIRWLVRFLSRILTPRRTFAVVFLRWQPDLVLSCDVQNEFDVRLIEDARAAKVSVVGMVRSWDNLTSKGLIRRFPGQLIVNNNIIKEEAIKFHAVPAEKIKVVGIPHYDAYVNFSGGSREKFFASIGADPAKRLVLFAPTGDRYLSNNTIDEEIVELLDKHLPADCQILVRFPPADTVRGLDGRSNSGRIFFDRPGYRYGTIKKTELSAEDDRHLIETLYHTDLVVAGPSTMSIDGAVFDKPVILVGFDGKGERPYYDGISRYYDYNHFEAIIKSGGVRLAQSEKEFVEVLKLYLAAPATDRDGRERIVREQVGGRDGKATERLAAVLLSFL